MDLSVDLSVFEMAFMIAVYLAGFMTCRVLSSSGTRAPRRERNRNSGTRRQPASTQAPAAGVIEIYVGNLSYDVDEKELESLFARHGKVISSRIIRNRFNDRSKGFGFIEMPNSSEANAAIAALNGMDIKGRRVTVNEARSSAR